MINRRNFLKTSAAAITGGIWAAQSSQAGSVLTPAAKQSIGLQLFTLFNTIDNDVTGNLKQVAAIGYQEIESAFSRKGGFYGMKPKEFASLTRNLGLRWQSHHVIGAPFKLPPGAKLPIDADGKPITIPPMKNLRDDAQELIDQAAEGGVNYLVCANIPISTLDEVKAAVEILTKSAEIAKKAGLTFCYHNHDAEFRAVEGQVPYEFFLSQTSADLVKMELDVAWAIKGGQDIAELIRTHAGRFPLWHLKDLSKDHQTIEPIGQGSIDYKTIFTHAKTAGVQHIFVEHDMPADALASITTSMKNLRKILG